MIKYILMKPKIIILAALMLLFVVQAFSQISESYSLSVNEDSSPLRVTSHSGKIVVKLQESEILNIDFGESLAASANSRMEIRAQSDDKIMLTQKLIAVKGKYQYDLKPAELALSAEKEEVYHLVLTDGSESQLIVRFVLER